MEKIENHQLSLLITEKCNLNCSYCYCDQSKSNTIEFNTACKNIDAFIADKKLKCKNQIHILFIGGEPFLKFDLLKRIVEYTLRTYPNLPIKFKAVTNGTMVHGKIQDWLIQNQKHFTVELSLDGEAESQNLGRNNTYTLIDISFFANKLKYTVANKVISPENIHNLSKDIMALEKKGFYVKAVIADGVNWSDENYMLILSKQLKILIDYYLANIKQTPFNLLCHAMYCIDNPNLRISKCEAGSTSYSVDTHGNILSCHRCSSYYNNGDWKIPHKNLDLSNTTILKKACINCIAEPICNSCPASIASKIDDANQSQASCLMMKSLFYANAFFFMELLLKCPDHIYFKNRDSKQIKASYHGAKQILEKLNTNHPF